MSLQEPTTSTGSPALVANEMLLVAHPAIGTVLLAEAIFGEMLAGPEQLDLLRLDLGEIVGMHMAPPEIRVLQIFIGAVAQHQLDAGADEGGREIAGRGETVDHTGAAPSRQIEPLARALTGILGLFAFRDVGPGADDLDGLALGVAHHMLLVVHPEIGAVRRGGCDTRSSARRSRTSRRPRH